MKLCNKISYKTLKEARENRIIERIVRGKMKRDYLYPYYCPDCGMIHNSHYKPNKFRK